MYDSVEIWEDHFYLYNKDVNLIKNSAKNLNLNLTLHMPSYDINPKKN
ncbi:hypothetical protein [Caminibacter mediatlanticus]|uniref:Uncharacterized protein n=1 Tax=Caminibacter mediatlanticus TB-2 TaxID=391592 RepID=A0AAI9AG46_9BACT|nr:hypothetical protein [Caminibacter mediatlanticus]EDM22897.1 hypothetical protein CMTB2_04052 [Caminibacter mediatlanticus TB-2]